MTTSINAKLYGTLDRRRKLTEAQREEILKTWNYEHEHLPKDKRKTAQALAYLYHVTKVTILKIVNPEYREKQHKYNVENCAKYYGRRTSEQRAAIAKESAAYKKKLHKAGLI